MFTTRGFDGRSNTRTGEIWYGHEGFNARPDDVSHITVVVLPSSVQWIDVYRVQDVQGHDSTRAISVGHRKFFETQGPARV